ncbi:MAG: CDP-alcohol phosphatidyltransferase family protein [Ornithinimicrobium sp.]
MDATKSVRSFSVDPRFFTLYVVGLMVAATVAIWASTWTPAPATGQGRAAFLAALAPPVIGMVMILAGSIRRRGSEPIGPADLVTVLRAALVSVVAAWAVLGLLSPGGTGGWPLTILATVALLLDGLDGAVARRSRPTRAGATLDAETDAVMMLALSVIVAADVGWWIVLAGALRYLFALTRAIRPAWRRPLPARRSRRAVAAWSSGLLAACTAPLLAGAPATALSVVALGLLLWSFGRDVAWLQRG